MEPLIADSKYQVLKETKSSEKETEVALRASSSLSSAPQLELEVDEILTLIPGFPYDVATFVLSFIPNSHQSRLKLVSKSWHAFFSSKSLFSLRSKHNHLSHLLCIFPDDPFISSPYLFDPEHLAWRALKPMPVNPFVYGLCNFAPVALGPYLYVLGGSLFDTRSFPLDHPMPSSAAFRYSFLASSWDCISPMLYPRGSFACTAIPGSNQIIVAGGGSRHTMFGAAGSRMSSVERYDAEGDNWVALDGLPSYRAGCVGFSVGHEEESEFWVMGGYGESRTLSGVFPVDVYCRDALVMDLKKNDSCTWREVGDMWGDGERDKLGKTVVIDDENCDRPAVFMLDANIIFRYDMGSNCWQKESNVPKKAHFEDSFGFVALNGELYVMSIWNGVCFSETRRSRHHKKAGTLYIQIYNPKEKSWRFLVSQPPFNYRNNFGKAVMCSVKL